MLKFQLFAEKIAPADAEKVAGAEISAENSAKADFSADILASTEISAFAES